MRRLGLLTYQWRRLDDEERAYTLAWRQRMRRPLHSITHLDQGQCYYLISAACYEHVAHIGLSAVRMNDFTTALLAEFAGVGCHVAAWVVLPNHYHVLADCRDVRQLLQALGKFHGRLSFFWNGDEGTRGRKAWCNAAETVKSAEHYHATLNYVLHNAVKHRYVKKWTDWHWSSAQDYLNEVEVR